MSNNLEYQYPPFEAYQADDSYIFVSYAHRDKKIVYPEIARLNSLGYRIWYDEGITPGSEWSDQIGNAIQKCNTFLVFISPQSVASENVRKEIYFAMGKKKLFLAIHIENTQLPPGLELQMSMNQAILKYNLKEEHYQHKLEQYLELPEEKLKKYSLAELMDLDPVNPIKDKEEIVETTTNTLAQWKGGQFSLSGVQEINETIAKALSQWKGNDLSLNEVQQIDKTTAKILSQWNGYYLYLNGVQQIDEATTKALTQFEGNWLSLNGLKQIDESIAKVLSQCKSKGLYLNGVQQIDEAVAKAITQFEGKWLSLNGLQELNEAVAKVFAQWKGNWLSLNGLQKIDNVTENALFQFKGTLVLKNRFYEKNSMDNSR